MIDKLVLGGICNWDMQIIDGCSLVLFIAPLSVASSHRTTEISLIQLHDSFVMVPLESISLHLHLHLTQWHHEQCMKRVNVL